MDKILPIISDLVVILFDLMIYLHLTVLKKDTRSRRAIMYGGCAVILAAYFITTYRFNVPASLASVTCMSIPSLILFWVLSKYKDARFFLTFCFVDTVTLILAFFSRYIAVLFGNQAGIAAVIVLMALCIGVYCALRPHFPKYRHLLECVDKGWGIMMVSSVLIYFALIFLAIYPKSLVERPEYGPHFVVFSLVILSNYMVFWRSFIQIDRIHEQSKQLQQQKKWHQMAYEDSLTGQLNRMAYMERINKLERERMADSQVAALVFDLDDFKHINDSRGHSTGDAVLKKAAECLADVFHEECYSLFRIGGDEFAVLAEGADETAVKQCLARLDAHLEQETAYSLSYGYDWARPMENNAIEQAFVRADANMYDNKRSKKDVPIGALR